MAPTATITNVKSVLLMYSIAERSRNLYIFTKYHICIKLNVITISQTVTRMEFEK